MQHRYDNLIIFQIFGFFATILILKYREKSLYFWWSDRFLSRRLFSDQVLTPGSDPDPILSRGLDPVAEICGTDPHACWQAIFIHASPSSPWIMILILDGKTQKTLVKENRTFF